MKGFVRNERLTPGGLAVGAEFRQTRRMFGREASEVFEVVAHEAPTRLGLRVDGARGASKQGEFLFSYSLVPDGDGTRLMLSGDIRRPGFFGRLIGKLMSGAMKQMIGRDLDAFVAYAELR